MCQTPLERFERAIASYMELHQIVERSLPPLTTSGDAAEIAAATAAMAKGMRAARSTAAEGEMFDKEIALIFRRIIREVLPREEPDAAELSFGDIEEPEAALFRPLVHDEFDWTRADDMSPRLLAALPELPDELQFRFVGRDLVIVDLHSGLVVDVLPDAIPPRERRCGARHADAPEAPMSAARSTQRTWAPGQRGVRCRLI
jgi:hypothetical protein